MFKKILVTNRGEIAVRAFRAAYETGASTVAVYPFEDRNSVHRLKADEAYEIHAEGSPVKAYLSVSEMIRVAKEAGADAIYPGYGFLSENPDLARAAKENGIVFVGPGPEVLELAGDKVNAKLAAIRAGVPVLASTESSDDVNVLVPQAQKIGFPLFVKAVAGGGGRGMRKVDQESELLQSLEAAMREAGSAFGDSRVFLEQAVSVRVTLKSRSLRICTATSFTYTSATAASSAETKRSSRLPRLQSWTTLLGSSSSAMQSPLLRKLVTRMLEPLSF